MFCSCSILFVLMLCHFVLMLCPCCVMLCLCCVRLFFMLVSCWVHVLFIFCSFCLHTCMVELCLYCVYVFCMLCGCLIHAVFTLCLCCGHVLWSCFVMLFIFSLSSVHIDLIFFSSSICVVFKLCLYYLVICLCCVHVVFLLYTGLHCRFMFMMISFGPHFQIL